ncbi:MAG: hypothetical protein WBB19_10210 [Desulforhopalus sp.]
MKDIPETTQANQHAPWKFLEALDRRISVSIAMDIEMDRIPFHLTAEGDSAVISFNTFSDALLLLKKFKTLSSRNNEQVVMLQRMLSRLGVTVCYQNRHFAFTGPKANLILSRLFTYATSFGRNNILTRPH